MKKNVLEAMLEKAMPMLDQSELEAVLVEDPEFLSDMLMFEAGKDMDDDEDNDYDYNFSVPSATRHAVPERRRNSRKHHRVDPFSWERNIKLGSSDVHLKKVDIENLSKLKLAKTKEEKRRLYACLNMEPEIAECISNKVKFIYSDQHRRHFHNGDSQYYAGRDYFGVPSAKERRYEERYNVNEDDISMSEAETIAECAIAAETASREKENRMEILGEKMNAASARLDEVSARLKILNRERESIMEEMFSIRKEMEKIIG